MTDGSSSCIGRQNYMYVYRSVCVDECGVLSKEAVIMECGSPDEKAICLPYLDRIRCPW